MSAERRRAAGLDRGHDFALIEREPVALRDAKTVAVAAEDVRHLQLRAHGALLFGRYDHEREPVEGAWGVGDQMSGDLRVACRRRQLGMPEQYLDDAKLDATFQEVCRKLCRGQWAFDGLAKLHFGCATRHASCKAAMLT
jgi:hypothetical protein